MRIYMRIVKLNEVQQSSREDTNLVVRPGLATAVCDSG